MGVDVWRLLGYRKVFKVGNGSTMLCAIMSKENKKEERKLVTLATITLQDDSLVITIKTRDKEEERKLTKEEFISKMDLEL